MKKVIETEKAPTPVGPYSQAIQTGNLIFLSGQIPIHPTTGEVVTGDVGQQTRQVLDNLKGILESQGLGMDSVVKVTVFLKDIRKFNQMNEVYKTYFPSLPPARSTIEVSGLAKDVDVEIEAIAAIS